MTYHNYIFFTINSNLHDVSKEDLQTYKYEFLNQFQQEKHVISNPYTTLGLKTNTNILVWFQAEEVEMIQDLVNKLLHTRLGKYLRISYTLFGMTRTSQYSSHSTNNEDTNRKGGKYLIIYPFTKTQSWYMLDFEKRKELMKGHMSIGRKYPQITQLLLYSYGIDDQEFIVSYETDDLSGFQKLVMELRSDKVREYTLKDTPIFTGIYKSLDKALEYL